jgi:hypothetical protein
VHAEGGSANTKPRSRCADFTSGKTKPDFVAVLETGIMLFFSFKMWPLFLSEKLLQKQMKY